MWKLLFWVRSPLGTQELQKRWLEDHAAKVAGQAQRLGIIRYVQNHRFAGKLDDLERSERKIVRADEEPLDILDELCFESRDALAEALETTAGREAVAEVLAYDESFLDFPRCQIHTVLEFPLINPSPETIVASASNSVLKTVAMVLPKPGDERLKDIALWMSYHVPLVRRLAPLLGIVRYIGSHPMSLAHPMPTQDDLEVRLRSMKAGMGTAAPDYQGVSCEWQSAEAAARWTIDSQSIDARRQIFKDEAELLDRGMFLIAKEHVIVDRYRH